MDTKYFKPKLEPSDEPVLKVGPTSSTLDFFGKSTFKLQTLVAFGALIQIIVFLMFPLRWAVVPACGLLLNSLITTLLQVQRTSDKYPEHVVPGRTTAILPSPSTGHHGPDSASDSLVVFNLGAQTNHPLGLFGPGFSEVGQWARDMYADLQKNKDEYELISMSSWTSSEKTTGANTLLTCYFRNIEGLHRFARSEVHRKGWDGYYNGKGWQKYVGIYHETFIVPRGGYETMYVNATPTQLGKGMVKSQTKDGEKYVNTLVNADTPALKTQWSRLGRNPNGSPKDADI